ncbi:N-acetyl-1-D-myo-inositol-2-amino-2-deoxy-alpha-D-glucopyranoside deacetylase [Pseudonocardia sp. N23]|uniref:N-acetyl-1-D-myo-inositol-2-amino-2-deoxy-alpha- D-glucopyranoside deacetylase n=1 Tax=Pseudonocardia sp. N23 TaxID=1987376 RepID=UPI000BFDA8C5|nr:N-acetyl-1-D-myo-inositol-2-amino-2-deoxy-alpha-D-glucopyranoside deacetylase [Pseudonocardia sp. N23]GAY13199.1 N-acetyl-1-D-myo-inosityl-2-amino-2-deoxy-alpha-D-glucopyranoside deacetylase MshB [Pseudonocardia sp. N23]
MTASRRLVLVHAHPDDETLATGGVVARYTADPDTDVTVVTCTLGEEGEVIPAELAELAPGRADQLGGYRIGELARALAALGGPRHVYLGGVGRFRDSGMALAGDGGVRATTRADLHPRAFADPGRLAEETDLLVELLTELQPQVLVTYADDGGYGHPDHVRAHEITVAAASRVPSVEKVYFAVEGRSALDAGLAELAAEAGLPYRLPDPGELPSVPDETVTTRIDCTAHRAARVAAIRAHVTQAYLWEKDGGLVAYAMSNDVAQPLLDVEEYILSGAPEGLAETDLFEGIGS